MGRSVSCLPVLVIGTEGKRCSKRVTNHVVTVLFL